LTPSQSSEIRSVAVIDDDAQEAGVMSILVEDAGFEPKVLANKYNTPRELAEMIREQTHAAICDHRLRHYAYATFDGAALVAELYEIRVPSILVTQYVNMDADVSIRRWRRRIPALVRRNEVDPDQIVGGFRDCLQEFAGDVPPRRKPLRSLVRVEEISSESGQSVVDAIVPSWNPREAIRFPSSLMPSQIVAELKPGSRLLAMVNIGANDATELYLYDFEIAPDTDPQNGLS